MVYPFRVRVKDEELAKIFRSLAQNRAVKVKDRRLAIKIGTKLKPIRKDIYMGSDARYKRSFVALPPELSLEYKPGYNSKKDLDFIFKWL